VAVGARDGRVLVPDTTPCTPVPALAVPAGLTARGAGSEVTALTFLSGVAALATVQPMLATVRLLAFKGALVLAVAGLELPSPQGAVAIEDGNLRVSGQNKVLVAAQETGAVIESVRLFRRMASLQFVRSPSDGEAAFAMVSQGIGYVEERSPQSLTLTRCALPAELPTAGARGAARGKVLVFDAAAPDFATRAPYELDVGNDVVRALADDEGRVVVVRRKRAFVFGAARARAGEANVVGALGLRGRGPSRPRRRAGGSRWPSRGTCRRCTSSTSRGSRGRHRAAATGSTPGALADPQLSPNGTEAYALLNRADGSGWLQVTDAANGRLSSVVLPIGGSDGVWFSHLAVSGSGQRVVAVDADRNVVAAFE